MRALVSVSDKTGVVEFAQQLRSLGWEILPVFHFLEKYGKVAHREMFNIFNMGIGMVIALDASEAEKAIEILTANGEKASIIGRIVEGEGVTIK